MADPVFRTGMGWETGGGEESYSGTAPIVQNRAAGAGSARPEEEYTAVFSWKDGSTTQPFAPGTSDWITIAAYLEFDNDTPGAILTFLRGRNLTPANYFTLRATTTSQTAELLDANGTSKGTTTGWKQDTKYHIHVKFKKLNSSDIRVIRDTLRDDGTVVRSDVMWDLTGVDCEPGGTELVAVLFNGVDPVVGGPAQFHASNIVIVTDSGTDIDSVNTFDHDYTHLCYQNTLQGIASDFAPSDNLELGFEWSKAGELPGNDANYARYTLPMGTVKGGGCWMNEGDRAGPHTDSRLPAAGVRFGAEFVWRIDKTAAAMKWAGRYGHNNAAPSTTSIVTLFGSGPYNKIQHINADAAEMPEGNESFAQGVRAEATRNAGNILIYDQWSILIVRRRKLRSLGIIRGPGVIPAP